MQRAWYYVMETFFFYGTNYPRIKARIGESEAKIVRHIYDEWKGAQTATE